MDVYNIDDDKQAFNHLTEPVRRGRRRIRREMVPELVAWLLTQSSQYQAIINHWKTIRERPSDGVLRDNTLYAQHAMSVIQSLINGIAGGIDGNNWRDAKQTVIDYLSSGDTDTLGNAMNPESPYVPSTEQE